MSSPSTGSNSGWSYTDEGRGAAVVLLHGLGSDADSWGRISPALAKSFRVVNFEIPGYSLAKPGPSSDDLDTLATSLASCLDAMNIRQYVLIGHSFGGAIAMVLARRAPTRCLALVLIAPGGFGPELNPAIVFMGTRAGAAALGALHGRRAAAVVRRVAARLEHSSTNPQARIVELMETYERLSTRASREQFRRSIKAGVLANSLSRNAEISALDAGIPIQIMWGANDKILPPWQADRALSMLPWSQVDLIADAGHTPQRTHPEAVLTVLETFLRSPAVSARVDPPVS
jgi:pimeloyl-ACP methyl ester carboxylesterase